MKKRIFTFIMSIFLVLLLPITALAHSGRTDSSGGHRDNKNKSGLGSYHYHCGGYPAHLHRGGVCPYRGGSSSGSSSSSSSSSSSTSKKVYASKINIENIPTNINDGESIALVASVYPKNAEDSTITWNSSDTSIATVNYQGVVTAVGVGTVVITAETSRGTSSKFELKINEVLAESIEIDDKETEMVVGDKSYLSATILPLNTTSKAIEWVSSDMNVIEIDEHGEIKAIGVGTATITAKHKDLTDTVEIEVKPVLAESIEIFCVNPETGDNFYETVFEKGSVIELAAKILPRDTTDSSVKWTVSSDIATLNDDGTLTLKKIGKVTITAETNNGKTDSIEIEIKQTQFESTLIIFTIITVSCIILFLVVKKFKTKKISSNNNLGNL